MTAATAPRRPSGLPANAAGTLADELRQPREAIDGAFLVVGAQLTECAAILSRITSTFEALPADLESQELNEATDRLAVVGQQASAIARSFAAEQEKLTGLARAVAAAGHPITELQQAVKMMGIVAINARVVAASVVDDESDFDVFTTDISQLSASAAKTIERFSLTYKSLVQAVGEAAQARRRFEENNRQALLELAERLDTNLGKVTESRHKSASGSATTGQLTRQIGMRVASTVMAMQVGDATRQRLEHIEAALAEPENGGPWVYELQRRLLDDATVTFESEVAEADEALRQLSADARGVLDHSRDLYGEGGNSGDTALGVLNTDVRWATTVLRDCEVEREKLDRLGHEVSSAVGILLDHVEAVQDIEAKMRLVSLNAAIRCAQLGPKARGLSVISQQLRSLTEETVMSARAGIETLTVASRYANDFTSDNEDSRAARVGDLEQEATASLAMLDLVGKRIADALTSLERDGPAVAARLKKAVASLSGHSGIAESMRDVGMRLGELSADGDEVPQSDAAAALLVSLRAAYTMDAERQIHDAFTGIAPPPAAAVAETGGDSIDDLLF